MEIHIDKPKLNKSTPQGNIALVDKWIADTADKLNAFVEQTNREVEKWKQEQLKSNS